MERPFPVHSHLGDQITMYTDKNLNSQTCSVMSHFALETSQKILEFSAKDEMEQLSQSVESMRNIVHDDLTISGRTFALVTPIAAFDGLYHHFKRESTQ